MTVNRHEATLTDLLARRDQRAAAQSKVGTIAIPGSEIYLKAVMPRQDKVLALYGELASATTAQGAMNVMKHALYDCCPQLQQKDLQEELGTEKNPMGTLDVLFSPLELDTLGEQALRFMGLMPDAEDSAEESAEDLVKN